MKSKNYKMLMKVCDYLKNPCWVFFDGAENPILHFSSLQRFIDSIFDDSILLSVHDFDTYCISSICLQQSLFDDEDNILMIYMV